MGQGNKQALQARPGVQPAGLPRAGLPARGAAQLPRAAGLGDRRRPRHLLDGGDGRGLRDRAGQPQPGALRPQEVRGDQRHAPAGAAEPGDLARADGALPPDRGSDRGRTDAEQQRDLLAAATPLVQERMVTLGECVDMLGFLFAGDDFTRDPADAAKLLDNDEGRAGRHGRARRAGRARHVGRRPRSTRRCAQALVEGLGLKPRNAFGPVRVAVTGRRISPPLFESLELLGRERVAGAARRGGVVSGPSVPPRARRRARRPTVHRRATRRSPNRPGSPGSRASLARRRRTPSRRAGSSHRATRRTRPTRRRRRRPTARSRRSRHAASELPARRSRRQYHLMLRTWTYAWWRPVVGVILLALGMIIVVPILTLPVLVVGVLDPGRTAGLPRRVPPGRHAAEADARRACSTSTSRSAR